MDNNNFNPDFSQDFNGQTSIPDDNFNNINNNINNISNNRTYSQYNQNQSASYAAYNQSGNGQFAAGSGYNPGFTPNNGYGSYQKPDFSISSQDLEKFRERQRLNQQKEKLVKTANRIGLGLLLSQVIVLIGTFIATPFAVKIDYNSIDLSDIMGSVSFDVVSLYLLNAVMCLLGFGIAGIVITKLNRLRLDDVLIIKRTPFSDTVKLITAGMGFVFVFNLLLTLMNVNLSLFGYKNTMPDYGTPDNLLGYILYFVSIAVVPPIIEEFIFRGAVLGSIRKLHGDTPAIIVSAALFGLAHANFVQTPVTFLTGLVLGYLTVKTGSIIPSMILHFLNNSIAVAGMFFEANNQHAFLLIDVGITFAFIVFGLISAKSLIKKYKNSLFVMENPAMDINMKQRLMAVFTAPWLIIFIIYSIIMCFMTAFSL